MWISPQELSNSVNDVALKDLLNGSKVAFWVFDRRVNQLVFTNAAFDQLTAAAPCGFSVHPSRLFFQIDRQDRPHFAKLIRHGRAGERAAAEVRWRCPKEGERCLEVEIGPLDGAPEAQLVGGSIVDVTQSRRTISQLSRAKRAAKRASSGKSQMLAATSHEIRNSLGAMLGYVELLGTEAHAPETRLEYLEIIRRNGEQLSQVTNDILDLSKAEAGQLIFEQAPFCPRVLLNDVIDLFRHAATSKNLTLASAFAPEVPVTTLGDAKRLKQILVNIVANSVKFTATGGIQIGVEYSASPEPRLSFLVADTGPGIAPGEQHKIFMPFRQCETHQSQGTGLGLPLARRLARGLGGDVTLEPALRGQGATFKVNVLAPLAATLKRDKQEARDLSVCGVNVLVVEDAPDNRLLLRRMLESGGATVATASNGLEAVRLAGQHFFDVVLMDIEMPVLNGLDATRQLRQAGYKRPIIALTAHAMQRELAECLRSGCDDHVIKPVTQGNLLATVCAYARSSRLQGHHVTQ